MADVANRIEGLSAEKRALLLEKLRQKGQARDGAAGPIPRRTDQSTFPLSFAQQRLWILSQLEPESASYNISFALRLAGQLDIRALEASYNEIVRRHDVLRATFITQRGNPVQVIAPEMRVTLHVEQAEGPEREATALRMAAEEARRPFDLAQGPLLRARLIQIDPDTAIALLTLHHIVTDGWSTGVLMREIALLYQAYADDNAAGFASPPLAPLPIQYADYAQWQREQLQGEALNQELAFWKEELAGIPPLLELPTDRPRPAVQTFTGAVYPFQLSPKITAGLQELARAEGASLYQVVLAAYQTLLHRYTGQTDICVGTPIANRPRPEVEGLIGFFVNTQVMRGRFESDTAGRAPSFRSVLRALKERALAAHAHQSLPFEMLVDEIAPQRDMSITPIFQVMFALEQRPTSTLRLPKLTLTTIETHSGTAKFDLTLFVQETPEGLRGSIEYSTDLWSASSIARMVGHFEMLLTSLLADPDKSVSALNILTPAERNQSLYLWNDTGTDYPRNKSLHTLFEEQVARRPDARAVTYGDRSLTYYELDREANRLANWLQSLGVGPEVLVGVYLERSLEMVVALLGIVKAGGAYLPLDVDYPVERLGFMMQDARAPVLLTQTSLAGRLPDTGAFIIRMDGDRDQLARYSDLGPATDVTPENLAYVIYTSGSTGVPKGVSIPQRAIARLIFNTNYIDLEPRDRVAQVSNASFDAATFEIWGALLRGAQLIGVSKELSLSPLAFADFLREAQISTMFITTALFNLIASKVGDAFSTLGHVMFGGEAVDPRWVRVVLRQGPPCRLLHVYGPTESTTFASWHLVREVAENAKTIPIGRPLSNTQLYVLDRNFRPVPVGVAGELCIGGDGLATGYLHRPDLTAEKFIPNPFPMTSAWQNTNGAPHANAKPAPAAHGERLYRTGDLVRFLPDGSIEFLGRIDHQVKIRGFRIELGEIETALSRHPGVNKAFIMVREDGAEGDIKNAERRVVAYLIPEAGQAPSPTELRAYLKQHLPEYMVPAEFVFMDALPLNANGKVDRRALPTPGHTRPDSDHAYIAPRTPIESFLCRKWQEVLHIERIGVQDNFFELGGNSLQAAVLTNSMQEELGATAHVRALFMAPTIADLAAYLEEYYPDAIARIIGLPAHALRTGVNTDIPGYTFQQRAGAANVDESKIAQFELIIPRLQPRIEPAEATADRNPPAIFVLSPPRSGSTLLRVMLAGHPALFAPPELDLLSFNTLAERRATFSGKYAFWLEGPIKAIMELRKCSVEEAEALMAQFERDGWTTKQMYRQLQAWIQETYPNGERLLVDKTPVYPMESNILHRMEQDFAGARYIHLMRNPYATVYSFMEAKLEDIFFRWEHPFTMRELAELVYLVSHHNILTFLETIPAERQHRVWFEELVGQSQQTMEGVCDFLGIPFTEAVVDPYKGERMTTGTRPGHQMAGDFKFGLRNHIDPKAADRWKKFNKGDSLSELTWDIAYRLGYQKPDDEMVVAPPPADPIVAQPRDASGQPVTPPALSYAQQRLWFLDQFEPGSPFYNVPAAVRLSGQLHIPALEQALNEIVRRHEVLRTTFSSENGAPAAVIAGDVAIPLPVIDLRGLPAEAREAEAQRLSAEEARKPFDLAAGPLLRGALLRLADTEFIALITMHHIVSDGWSVGVFIKELAALYDVFSSGKAPSPELASVAAGLAPLSVQYGDFATWQRKWFDAARAPNGTAAGQGAVLQQQLAFWKDALKGLPPRLDLPTDRPRPAVQTQNGARLTFTLPEQLSNELKALSRKEGATLFMTLLAAYQTLLMRYTGQEDIAVGTPIAGRNRPEIAPLIGFFVNTLVMRGNLTPDAGANSLSFRELIRRTKATAIRAFEHQDVPFEMLVEELQPTRDMSHTPLFQAMFALQDAPLRALKMQGLQFSPLEPDTKTAKFDLMLNIVERPDVLRGALEYNTDLFNASTAARMVGHWETLLAAIVADPDLAVSALPILTETETHSLLNTWNDTAVDVTGPRTLVEAFARQVAATPDAPAVIAPHEGRTLSFAELDRHAAALAQRLHGLGVGPESIVGLLAERSAEALVAIWGILKAGGAYLPLDPDYPADRITYIMEDSGARVLVAGSRLLEAGDSKLEAGSWKLDRDGVMVVPIEELSASGSEAIGSSIQDATFSIQHPGSSIQHPASGFRLPESSIQNPVSDNLAYVIYTSGSTGRPKGVMIQHRSALNLRAALQRVAYVHAPEARTLRISLNAPLPFDASMQQLVMLTLGHALVVIPQEVRGDGEALLQFIREQQLDQLDCVPSQLKLLLAAGLLDPQAPWTPRIVFPGGEAIDETTWRALACAPETEFFNMYGPTECTVDSTTLAARQAPEQPSIGRPLANVRAYVLDRNLQAVPIGTPGELFLAGAGVGRGYLNQPELTAERFLPDPFAAITGGRMYRTGDLVRWLPNGTLDFLGRVDFQVKIRGFRIELGEIEETLRKHPGVKEVVVVARNGGANGQAQRLVAYVTPADADGAAPLTSTLLRQHLLQTLPDYMAPAAFVMLPALPLTPNGKVDRRALPAPEDATRAEVETTYVAPASPAEQTLAEIWRTVLGVPRVGANDNFFELGGDSILTIQVVARAAQAGLRLTPKQVFQAPTVAGLALLVETTPAATTEAEQGLVEGEAPLTPIQRRFFSLDLPNPHHWNQSLLLAVRVPLNAPAMAAAVAAVARHHDALRMRYTQTPQGWRQRNAGLDGGDAATFEVLTVEGDSDAARQAALSERIAAVQANLNIIHGPLLRVIYLDYGPDQAGRLLIVVHHLVVDRVSWRMLLEDLAHGYEQAAAGAEIALPARKTTAYRDWAARLAEYAGRAVVAAEAPYWRNLPAGATLTPDNLHGANTERAARTITTYLSPEETEALLKQVGAVYGAEVHEVLLAGLALAFQHAGEPTPLALEVESHGRRDDLLNADGAPPVDTSRTLGWFTSVHPLTLSLAELHHPGAVLLGIKEQVRATPAGGFHYGLLRYLVEDPALKNRPAPQVSFNYLGLFVDREGADGLPGGAFAPAPEPTLLDHDPQSGRQYLLDITASVYGGRLRVEWTYGGEQFTAGRIDRLAQCYLDALGELIRHCQSPEAGGYSQSDFKEAGLSADEFEGLLDELGEFE